MNMYVFIYIIFLMIYQHHIWLVGKKVFCKWNRESKVFNSTYLISFQGHGHTNIGIVYVIFGLV